MIESDFGLSTRNDYLRLGPWRLFCWLLGRLAHQVLRTAMRNRGWGKDRVIVVGTGDMAQVVIQRILRSPYLGYELLGVVNGIRKGQ